MEPLAHTLAGACLAESGLKRLTPLATSTLLIAANIPDLDGACYLHSADLAFAFRRGWTHGRSRSAPASRSARPLPSGRTRGPAS